MNNLNPSPYFSESFLVRASTGLPSSIVAKLAGFKPSDLKAWESGTATPPEGALDKISSLALPYVRQPSGNFRFIDLFAGIGGMRRAFESAGGECVFTSEWNKMALETYLANHGSGHVVAGDITKVSAEDVPDHDVLVAGFPCQPFSLAGVSVRNSMGRPHGFADATQGTLFFDVARIIAAKQPAAFVLENVRNLVSHDKGNTFEVIKRTLREELGYTISYKVMDSSPWVPQKRNRIVIVGFRDGHEFDFSTVVTPETKPVLADILHCNTDGDASFSPYALFGVVLPKYTLSDKLWSFLQNYAAKHAAKGNGFGCNVVGPQDVARTLSARYGKDGAEILIRQDGRNPRRLTPRECARLMGFDRKDAPPMIIPVSDAQAYKQFGNSVAVPMFAAVAQAMATHVVDCVAAAKPFEHAAA